MSGESGGDERKVGKSRTLTAPMSLTITAILRPWFLSLRMYSNSVVFPLPRKPLRIVTGRRPSSEIFRRGGDASRGGVEVRLGELVILLFDMMSSVVEASEGR